MAHSLLGRVAWKEAHSKPWCVLRKMNNLQVYIPIYAIWDILGQ